VPQAPDPIDTFAELARSLAEQDSLEDILQCIVEMAVPTVPGAACAGVSHVTAGKQVETVAATEEVCRLVDQVQYETAEGPCLDAIWEQETVKIDDLAGTDRWPRFSEGALEIGIRSVLAFRLFVQEDRMGALNLYAREPKSFTDASVHLGQVFAAHAAVAWDHAREADGLKAAVATRALIGQAQGLLMAQYKITADAGFGLLRTASQRRNVKLRDIAQEVVDTGVLSAEP
jgi:GAF domain-containing protein